MKKTTLLFLVFSIASATQAENDTWHQQAIEKTAQQLKDAKATLCLFRNQDNKTMSGRSKQFGGAAATCLSLPCFILSITSFLSDGNNLLSEDTMQSIAISSLSAAGIFIGAGCTLSYTGNNELKKRFIYIKNKQTMLEHIAHQYKQLLHQLKSKVITQHEYKIEKTKIELEKKQLALDLLQNKHISKLIPICKMSACGYFALIGALTSILGISVACTHIHQDAQDEFLPASAYGCLGILSGAIGYLFGKSGYNHWKQIDAYRQERIDQLNDQIATLKQKLNSLEA